MLPSIEQRLAAEIAAKPAQIAAAIELLDEGATVPFETKRVSIAIAFSTPTATRRLPDYMVWTNISPHKSIEVCHANRQYP